MPAIIRVISSVGRASRLHREGRQFEPVITHQFRSGSISVSIAACHAAGPGSTPGRTATLLSRSSIGQDSGNLAEGFDSLRDTIYLRHG